MRTRIDIASWAAGPRSPSNIAWSLALKSSIAVNYNPRMRQASVALFAVIVVTVGASGFSRTFAQRARDDANAPVTLLKPARVFDGDAMHEGWAVRVKGERIDAVGADVTAPGAKVIDLPGTTLMPGLVEGHSHILLHAYSETSWTDQVSRRSEE